MDPTTVIIVLATHLVCSGGLYLLIGRGMPPRSGLGPWGAGCLLFGVAYLARLAVGLQNTPHWIALMDVTMMIAVGLFLSGLREYLGRPAVRCMRPSMSASYHMLSAPEAPAPMLIATSATRPSQGWMPPGAIAMPTKAVKTTSDMTRGLRSAK